LIHLDPLYYAVSWVLLRWHSLFTLIGINRDSGINWALSIIFLTMTARVLLFRLFLKQVRYQRKMATLQPKLNAIKEKYKNDRASQQREMMALQQAEGFNPLAGCLPLFIQFPVFICLFHVLRHLANSRGATTSQRNLTLYGFTKTETLSAAHARLFDAPLADTVVKHNGLIPHFVGSSAGVTVTIVLIVISAGATFFNQLLVRSAQLTPPEGTAATIQKVMLYFIPLSVVFSGLFFPLGVLLYWFTSNVWTLGQQAYVNRYHPHVEDTKPSVELGKTLAPKVGVKPVKSTGKRPVKPTSPNGVNGTTANDATDSAADDRVSLDKGQDVSAPNSKSVTGEASPPPPPPRTPRPGARPTRTGPNRPSGNRPKQAKKRR
jgi:YidC/Oxa1 family membrane protein insertase